MKNYYDTRCEADLVRIRLKVLREKKDILRSIVEPRASRTDELKIDLGKLSTDVSMVTYVYLVSETDKKLRKQRASFFIWRINFVKWKKF